MINVLDYLDTRLQALEAEIDFFGQHTPEMAEEARQELNVVITLIATVKEKMI